MKGQYVIVLTTRLNEKVVYGGPWDTEREALKAISRKLIPGVALPVSLRSLDEWSEYEGR